MPPAKPKPVNRESDEGVNQVAQKPDFRPGRGAWPNGGGIKTVRGVCETHQALAAVRRHESGPRRSGRLDYLALSRGSIERRPSQTSTHWGHPSGASGPRPPACCHRTAGCGPSGTATDSPTVAFDRSTARCCSSTAGYPCPGFVRRGKRKEVRREICGNARLLEQRRQHVGESF